MPPQRSSLPSPAALGLCDLSMGRLRQEEVCGEGEGFWGVNGFLGAGANIKSDFHCHLGGVQPDFLRECVSSQGCTAEDEAFVPLFDL